MQLWITLLKMIVYRYLAFWSSPKESQHNTRCRSNYMWENRHSKNTENLQGIILYILTHMKCTEFTTHNHSHSQIHLKLLLLTIHKCTIMLANMICALNESGVVPSSIKSWVHSCKFFISLLVFLCIPYGNTYT